MWNVWMGRQIHTKIFLVESIHKKNNFPNFLAFCIRFSLYYSCSCLTVFMFEFFHLTILSFKRCFFSYILCQPRILASKLFSLLSPIGISRKIRFWGKKFFWTADVRENQHLRLPYISHTLEKYSPIYLLLILNENKK